MTTNGLLNFLDGAPYGAFAVNMNKTIVFWNRGAERILEHEADQAIGCSCCEVMAGIAQDGNSPVCSEGCPAIEFAKQGHVPAVHQVDVLCASGKRKPIMLTPLIVPAERPEQRVLVLLFHELLDSERAGRIATTVGDVLSASRSLRSIHVSSGISAVQSSMALMTSERNGLSAFQYMFASYCTHQR